MFWGPDFRHRDETRAHSVPATTDYDSKAEKIGSPTLPFVCDCARQIASTPGPSIAMETDDPESHTAQWHRAQDTA